MGKGSNLKVRRFWGLTPTFVEVAEEKLVGGSFAPSPSPPRYPHLNRFNISISEEGQTFELGQSTEYYIRKISMKLILIKFRPLLNFFQSALSLALSLWATTQKERQPPSHNANHCTLSRMI